MKHKPTIHPADLTEHLAVSHPANVSGIELMVYSGKVRAEYSGTTWPLEESSKSYLLRKCIYQLN